LTRIWYNWGNSNTPDVRSGRPRIAGTRIIVVNVVITHLRLGQSLEETTGKYDLDLDQGG